MTGFATKILNWVFLPIIILSVVLALFGESNKRNKCETTCKELGYFGCRYTPAYNRYGTSEQKCHCLTEEETKITNKIPQGTHVY